jgi:hypothetical protein
MKEVHQTPVDITCCNSKYCPNEDWPTSATNQRRDSCNKSASSDTETLVVLLFAIGPHFLIGAVISVEAFLLLRVKRVFQVTHSPGLDSSCLKKN